MMTLLFYVWLAFAVLVIAGLALGAAQKRPPP